MPWYVAPSGGFFEENQSSNELYAIAPVDIHCPQMQIQGLPANEIAVSLTTRQQQGKQGKLSMIFPVRENTGNLEILPKHREF